MDFRKIAVLAMVFGFSICTFYSMEIQERKFQDLRIITELNSLILKKDAQKASDLLNNVTWKVDVNGLGENGHYPIHDAVMANDLVMVKELVEKHGADVNVLTQRNKYSPLDIAVSRQQNHIISYLNSKGARHNQYDVASGKFKGQIETERRAIAEVKEKVLEKFTEDFKKWINHKSYQAALSGVKYYFEKYPNYIKDFELCSTRFVGGDRPLYLIVKNGDDNWLDLVKYLIETGGFNPNNANAPSDLVNLNEPFSLYGQALKNGCTKIAQYLRNKGAKTDEEFMKDLDKK